MTDNKTFDPGFDREAKSAEHSLAMETFSVSGFESPARKNSNVTTNGHVPETEKTEEKSLLYEVTDVPPWYLCIFLGFQHYLEMLSATIAIPFILTPAMCMSGDDPDRANITSTLVFMSGIITILQSTVGSRLPIVQGGSFSYLIPALAILNLPQWRCPSAEVMSGMNQTERQELWQVRMREVQGAIIFGALFEAVFAITGFIGFLCKFITPLTIAPAISMIGLSIFQEVTKESMKNPPVAISMIALLVFLSQHLKNVRIPKLCGEKKDPKKAGFPVFQVFPVIISLLVVWGVCTILTITNVLPEGDAARSDAKLNILKATPWFRVPYPFQWGWPTVSIGAVIGVLCGVMTSTIETLGDYFACATMTNLPTPPKHALNRGIFIQGMGCMMSGVMGSGNASTSYSNNIGTLIMTRVASRRVVQVAGVIMITVSLVGKVGAIFIGIPDPILGAMFWYICPLVTAVGIGTLSEICLESARNIFIFSFALFTGLAVSFFAQTNPDIIHTGSPGLDALLQILLSTGMFISGVTGFILDNTIAGTDKERGLVHRKAAEAASLISRDTTYDLPFGMGIIKRLSFLEWLPISPTYEKSVFDFWKSEDEGIPTTVQNRNSY